MAPCRRGSTVIGNYSQAADTALTESFGNYSTFHVKQNATLSGALNITVNRKHPPASGAKYTALTAGSLSGSFTSHLAGFTLTISATSVQGDKAISGGAETEFCYETSS